MGEIFLVDGHSQLREDLTLRRFGETNKGAIRQAIVPVSHVFLLLLFLLLLFYSINKVHFSVFGTYTSFMSLDIGEHFFSDCPDRRNLATAAK